MLEFVPCAQTQKCPRRNKRGLAVLFCFLLFILSTHFQQLVYFIFLCRSYCRLFSVDSCTAVWTTIGNVVAAVRQSICFEAVVTGIAVVKFQFLITSVLLRACNVCGYCYVIGTHIKPCFSLNSRTSAAFTSSNRGRSSSSGSSSGLIFPRTLPTMVTWSSSDFSPYGRALFKE